MSSPGDSTRDPIDHAFTVSADAGADPAVDPTVTRAADFFAPDGDSLPTVSGYEVLGVLGRGGVGVVYKARQLALNRVVAIKLISGMASVAVLIRFRQEAEAVARLQHPNIIQVFEVGSCPAGSFLALEYVDGGTLKEKVAGVPHPPRDAARAVETLARAVHHAHEHRLIHRDLKPHNVLLTAGGVPKIADFGLARSLDAGDGGVTITTDFVGTPAYAAPEQVAAQFGAIGPATDVYSLGVILYELLVGRVPFDAGSVPEVLRMVADTEPVSPRRLRPEIPRDLETICLKCLRKEPGKRYASATDLADDLHHFQAGEPISARPVGKLERAARWAKRNPAVAGLMGAVFALLTLVAVVATVAAVRIDAARQEAYADAGVQSAAREVAQEESARKDRELARLATRSEKEQRLQALISEAQATRYSHRIGQRFGTLTAVRKATDLARELGKPAATFDELRNLAIAALALPDLKPDSVWVRPPTDPDVNWWPPIPDPTYRRIAFTHQRGEIRIHRAGTGPDDRDELARFEGFGSEVGVQWSADGRYLGAMHWQLQLHRFQLWRMDGERPVLTLEVPKDCLGFVFTPDAREVITMEGEHARTYDLATGRSTREFVLPVGAKAISHNPRRPELAVGLPTRTAILELPSGKEIGSLPVAGGHMWWHPHGELLAVAAENYIDVWDVARRRREWRLNHTGGGLQASFNPTGDLVATTGWTGRQRLWNAYTGREVFSTIGLGSFVHGERLSTRFPAFAADPAGPLTVVEAAREYRTLPVAVGQVGIYGLIGCSVHPDGRLLAVSCYQGFSLLDLTTGSERAFVRSQAACRDVLFEPDGSLLVKTSAGVSRWPVAPEPGAPNRLRVGPPELIPVQAGGESFARSTDGAVLAATGAPSGAAVWQRDRPYDAIPLTHADCRHVAVSPDGKLVATGSWSGRGIKVWEADTGRLVRSLMPEAGGAMPIFSPDGKWLANASRGERWRVADWSEGPKPPGGTAGGRFSPDSRLVAWGMKGFIVLADAESGRELARLEDPHQDGLNGFTFSADGALLLGATNDSVCVRVWDLRKIRAGLAELGLDWDAPPYPKWTSPDPGSLPLQVRVVGENLFASTVLMQQAERNRALLAVWLNPFDPDARLALGTQLLNAGRVGEANANLTAAIAFRPDQVYAYAQRVTARFRLGDWAGCAADADAVLAKRPDDKLMRWYRGLARVRSGRHADALPDLTASVANYPLSAAVHLARADAYEALGKIDESAADWKRAGELATPQNSWVELNNIAWHLLTGPPTIRDAKRGLELARMADAKQTGNGVVLNTLGFALYRNGMTKGAIVPLERSMQLGQGRFDGHNLFMLAMCYAKLGYASDARDCYQRARTWVAAQTNLIPQYVTELAALRAEAEQALHAAGVATEPAPPPRDK